MIIPIRRRSKREPIRRFKRRRVEGVVAVVAIVAIGEVARRTERTMGKKRRPSPESSRDFRTENGIMRWKNV